MQINSKGVKWLMEQMFIQGIFAGYESSKDEDTERKPMYTFDRAYHQVMIDFQKRCDEVDNG